MNSVEEKILAAARYKLNVDEKVSKSVILKTVFNQHIILHSTEFTAGQLAGQ